MVEVLTPIEWCRVRAPGGKTNRLQTAGQILDLCFRGLVEIQKDEFDRTCFVSRRQCKSATQSLPAIDLRILTQIELHEERRWTLGSETSFTLDDAFITRVLLQQGQLEMRRTRRFGRPTLQCSQSGQAALYATTHAEVAAVDAEPHIRAATRLPRAVARGEKLLRYELEAFCAEPPSCYQGPLTPEHLRQLVAVLAAEPKE